MKQDVNVDQLMDNVVFALRECYDPEIPVNIYDLGLIYEINVNEIGRVDIVMTLTSPACPVAETLPLQVEQMVAKAELVSEAHVSVTWEPSWDWSMMSEEARLELGMM